MAAAAPRSFCRNDAVWSAAAAYLQRKQFSFFSRALFEVTLSFSRMLLPPAAAIQ